MSRYAHVNLLDLDDSVAGRLDGLEGRFGRSKLESRDLGISHWRYAPNLQVPAGHRHREQEEAYIVVGRLGPDPDRRRGDRAALWDVVRLAPETVRAFAAGPDGMELIAVGGPKPEGGDGEQVPVSWPD